MMARTPDATRAAHLEAQLAQIKARMSDKVRKRRTSQLIAVGLAVQGLLRRDPSVPTTWLIEAAAYLDERQRGLVQELIADIAHARNRKNGGSPE